MKPLIKIAFGNWRRALVSVFFTALLIRLGFVSTLQDAFYFPDSVAYSGAAVRLVTNGEFGPYNRPPGYAVFLAAIYMLFGESILAARIVESFLGAFLAVVIALTAKRIGGQVVGALAGILWSIYPIGIFIAGLVYPESLLTLLLGGGVLCLLHYSPQEVSPKGVFLAGILWGLAALTKPVVLATIGAVGLWVFCWSRGNRVLLAALLFGGAALTVVPWTIRDFYVYDRFVVIDPQAVDHLPRMPAAQQNGQKVQAILDHPELFALRFGREFFQFWKLYPDRLIMDWPRFREGEHLKDERVVKETIFTKNTLITAISVLSTGPVFFFAIIGTAAMWLRRDRWRDLSLLLITILSFASVYSIFYAKTRYRVPIEPYIIILSAYGLSSTWSTLEQYFAYEKSSERTCLESRETISSS
jgi:4-amino-4-deoxy-L-arabinose transferase-like glycosyltransferase